MSFFHPDFTVGVGISPTQLALADYTAGRESHSALKTFFSLRNISYLSFIYNKKVLFLPAPNGMNLRHIVLSLCFFFYYPFL